MNNVKVIADKMNEILNDTLEASQDKPVYVYSKVMGMLSTLHAVGLLFDDDFMSAREEVDLFLRNKRPISFCFRGQEPDDDWGTKEKIIIFRAPGTNDGTPWQNLVGGNV